MSVAGLTEFEDTYEADLAKAIEASLQEAPASGGSGNPAWDALLAASQAVAAGGGGAAATAAAGRASPVLMLPAPPPRLGGALASRLGDVDEDDDDFQRQLAAAMAASIQSAEEDSHRRKYGLPAAAPHAAALPSIFPGMGGGAGAFNATALLPGNSSVFAAWATEGPAARPADALPAAAGVGSAASGVLGAAFQRGGLHDAARQSSAPVPGLALVPSLLAGPPPGSPTSSTAASAGGSGPSSPVFAPPFASQHTAPHQAARHAAAAIPPRPAGAAAAAAAAASLLLSASPGKHGRTPSHSSLPEAIQPHMKRSRPASDSGAGNGVSAFGAGAGLQATAESSGAYGGLGGRNGGAGVGAGAARATSSGLSGQIAARRLGGGDAADSCARGGGGGVRGTWTDLRGRCASVVAADLLAGAHGESPPTRPASAASGCNPSALAEAAAAVSLAPLDLPAATSVPSGSLAPASLLFPQQHQQHAQMQQLERSGSVADGGSGLRGAVAALDLSRPAVPLEQLLHPPQAQSHHPHPHAVELRVPARRAASLTTGLHATAAPAVAEPMPMDTGGLQHPPAAAPAAADGAADRRLLQHQRVWWWLGPSQAQLGRVISIDRRSTPLLYSVRLDAPAGGGEGEVVIATADCLLPFIMYGEAVMCRLEEATPDLAPASAGEGQDAVQAAGTVGGEEASTPPHFSSAVPRSCAWARGVLQHCVFDGPVPAVHVLLQQPNGAVPLPCTVPYAAVVPCADAAEGSGSSRSVPDEAVGGAGMGVGGWELQRYDSMIGPQPAFGVPAVALEPVTSWVRRDHWLAACGVRMMQR
ncbi:hypothetical protein HXX76_005979 [Chlamydomonas incerta]|uniref:Uncharacterized protein n=1 Tax=Chlamydomonas incerta TaxID=51695 RepID=A0A835W1P9_CHLIN|nr:hypothetical protein HXX76_005979 [Chlamydomonas incerta]|eukprot:KAG2437322.1 hypothetical protein HXX76_005979 [Chlamydomonas incerta]